MERDDCIEYSLDISHSEEEGKQIRKRLMKVFWLLLGVTIFEVFIGAWWSHLNLPWALVKVSFILLTIVKAGYIVMIFMHLWDEFQFLRYIILVPYITFILYLLFICIVESLGIHHYDLLWG